MGILFVQTAQYFMRNLVFIIIFVGTCFSLSAQRKRFVVNDVTQLNPIEVANIITPKTTADIVTAVKANKGPISIGGGRFSMGGQTATERALQIDMRSFDSILYFSKDKKEITVQAGITWRKIQEFIDPHDLSVSIMQTYANFTVGGSLSVNVHGRYIGKGPIILSVKEIKIVLADGSLFIASPDLNKELFYGAIGGYGALGIITEATLMLSDNCKVERVDKLMPVSSYHQYFFDNIRNDSLVVFHNADFYPNAYQKVRAISYLKTNKEFTVKHRMKPLGGKY